MRFPDKERESFTSPCWSADDIASYTGPVFRATVTWRTAEGRHCSSDLEEPSMIALSESIAKVMARHDHSFCTMGPHTEGEHQP